MAKQFSDEPNQENSDKIFQVNFVYKSYNKNLFQFNIESMGLDLEYDADVPPTGHEPATYEPVFMSTHKAPCRSATFNTDGLILIPTRN